MRKLVSQKRLKGYLCHLSTLSGDKLSRDNYTTKGKNNLSLLMINLEINCLKLVNQITN